MTEGPGNDDQRPANDGSSADGKSPSATASTATSAAPRLDRFGAAAKESREAAKWLVAGFGAIGAALVAGTQLSSIGTIQDPARLFVAIAAVSVGLGAAAAGAGITMWVLLPGYTSLSDVANEERAGRRRTNFAYYGDVLTKSPDVGEGYARAVAGPGGLLDQFQTALDLRASRYQEYLETFTTDAQDRSAKRRVFRVANVRAKELGRVALNVVTVAGYRRVNRGARPWVVAIVLLALVIGASLAVFAWAANPADAESAGSSVSLRGVVLSGADLSGRDLTNVDFEGATLADVNLRGAKLDEETLGNVVWQDVICPDGVASGAAGTCLGHLH
jgi:hypothetical protein